MEQLEKDICYLRKIQDRLEQTTAEISNEARNKAIDDMTLKMPDYEAEEQPQPEGYYYCPDCRRETYHSHYSPRSNDFYEHASDEELAAAYDEPDRLICDRCQERIEREARGEEG